MPKMIFDGQEIEVPAGMTVLQAARVAGIEIPVFCYHERLDIAGNCRMCLVEMQGAPKPIASCAMPVSEGMVIRTTTPMVKKAREGVLEFLLINHPLDCPICDQGGECDLQDITMSYGCGSSRYEEDKRAVPPKHMGPLVKTEMTRCIHCTRCVRFLQGVAGVGELATTGRGEDAQIESFLDRPLTSELSGNIIDLCPVGALTSRPYAFRGRPWALTKTPSIDVLDALGSAIRIDSAHGVVERIMPRLNEDVNEEWLSDRSRFSCDGLRLQRLDRPYVRGENGRLEPASWEDAFEAIKGKLHGTHGSKIGAIAGDLVDVEAMTSLLDLMDALGSPHTDCRQDSAHLEPASRASYLFNTPLSAFSQATRCLIIDADLRAEAPLLAARLRTRFNQGGFEVAYLGTPLDKKRALTFPVTDLGDDPGTLDALISGKHPWAKDLKDHPNTFIIVGTSALERRDGAGILGRVRAFVDAHNLVRDDWHGFNVLHRAAARVGGLDIGFVPTNHGWSTSLMLQAAKRGDLDVMYLLGADDIDMSMLGKAFVIYQGHHGDQGAARADVVLPSLAYTEKDGTYVNTLGMVQRAYQGLKGPGFAKPDWRIIADLATALGHPLGYDTLQGVRGRMTERNPLFGPNGEAVARPWSTFGDVHAALDPGAFHSSRTSLYMGNVISRASPTMAACEAIQREDAHHA